VMGQARRGREKKERGGECACSIGVREESLLLMQRVPPPLVPILHMMTCMLSHVRGPGNECFRHLAHVWVMRYPKLLGKTPN
jgi:hypothetical protein